MSVPYPAIWVHHFGVQSQDPAVGVLGKGIADMLITDLSEVSSRGCRAEVVEREKIGEMMNEQELQQLPGFDPSTRVRTDQIHRDNSSVTGTVAEAGGQMTLTATYTNRQTGSRGTVSVTGSAQRFYELEQRLSAKLADLICQPGPPYYYRVLAASETTHTDASQPSNGGLCDSVGGTSGSLDFGGTLAAAQFSADNKLDKDFGGNLTGRIWAKVPEATTNHTLHGCKFGADGITACSTVLPDDPPVPWSLGFSISGDRPGASTVKLTGSVLYPSVGAVSGGDPNATCLVNISGSNIPTQELQQDVPVSLLASTTPFTITFAGQHTWNKDALGQPATITKSWNYSLTIQRVDANGKRL